MRSHNGEDDRHTLTGSKVLTLLGISMPSTVCSPGNLSSYSPNPTLGMLDHQIEFSKATADLYNPISGRVSDPDSIVSEGNTEGIRACEEYIAIVKALKETLKPELEMIETRVIKPADELLEIIKVIRKTAVKRDHKQLDYDRHRTNLKKLQDKKERNLKDEKALYKAENDVEQATQEYNYFNDLLKDDLPKLFRL